MSVPYTVIAKYPYTPSAENASDDLAFSAGQLITVTEEVDADWLFGTSKTGGELVSGYFPRNFVEKQAEDEPEEVATAEGAPDAPGETQSPEEPQLESPVAQPPVPDPASRLVSDPVSQSVSPTHADPFSAEPQSTIEYGTSDFKHKLQSFNVGSAPPMHGQAVADTNFVKKTFIAASPHSTYVPPVERRESRSDERRVSSGSSAVPHAPPPAQQAADEHSNAEEDVPRMTLKERLRLLEDRQREEQAAAEALMKRREEKKKKKEMREEPAEENEENEETEEEQHEEETEQDREAEEDEDEEEEEDEEEAKRRQLRERMAKLSGGMGMIGMMGFGAPMPAKEKKVKESKRTDDAAATPVPGPVPVVPTKPDPQEAAPESAGEESQESSDHESVDLTKQPDVGDEEDLPAELEEPKPLASAAVPARPSPPPIPTSPAVPQPPTVTALPASFYAADRAPPPPPPPPPQDQASESDDENKSASAASPTLSVSSPVAPVPPVPVPVPTSPPAPAVAQAPRAPTSTAPPVPPVPAVPPVPPPMSDSSEEVVTGYEADDDTDIAQAEKPVNSPMRPAPVVAPPPPVTKAPTAPLPPKTSPAVPAARPPPPIPTSPLAQTAPRAFPSSSVQSKERRLSGSKTATSHIPPPPPPVAAPVQTDNTGSTMHSGFRSSMEISDYGSSSKWWLTKSLPAELSARDVYYEVDSHELKKRNGKTVVYLDYYVVNQDYSTKIWELSYDAANPDKLATFVETVREKPAANSTYLLEASRKYGAVAFQLSSSVVGTSKVQEDLVSWVFKQLPHDVMPPVGSKTFGATIYRNTNNVEINQLDEIRPGDVLVILKGRFEGHSSGPFHKSKTAELGFNGKPYAAFVAGFDPSKGKIKVIEQSARGVQSASYKLGDFKSGKIRIFRIVGRNYFGW